MLNKETTKQNIFVSCLLFLALSLIALIQPYVSRAYASCNRKWNDWRAKRNSVKEAVTS